jgi:hypothetical protein
VAADIRRVTRSLGLVFLLVSLALGGFLFTRQSPGSQALEQQAQTQADAAAAATSFAAAVPTLQAWYADHGTFAGATLPPAYGITVVRADAVSYCLQSGGEHVDGPNGTPAPGPC